MKKCRVKVDAVTLVAAKDSVVIVSDKQFDLISHLVEEITPKKGKKDESNDLQNNQVDSKDVSTDLQNNQVDSKDVSTDQSTLDETSKSEVVDDSTVKQDEIKE